MKKDSIGEQVELYINPDDGRFEDLANRQVFRNISKDLVAGLIVAATTIPIAVGMAMASGMRPEQGIIGGAIAGLLGALFCGSKYQVYGPAAALIPVMAGVIVVYGGGIMILASVIAGLLLLVSCFLRVGPVIEKIPRFVTVGFTIGTALIIAFSQISYIAGLKETGGYPLMDQLHFVADNINKVNIAAIVMTVCTFILCQAFLKISRFIPGPLIALAFGYLGTLTFWSDKGLVLIADKYESMGDSFFAVISPGLPAKWDTEVVFDLVYCSLAIYLVVIIESLSGGYRADRLSGNTGHPFNQQKELWGLGLINIFCPLMNGFPHAGVWGGTSLNIRAGALSPLSGITRSVFLLSLTAIFFTYFEKIPVACISGILLSAAFTMIKRREVKKVLHMGRPQVMLMIYTAIMVPLAGFMIGLLSAILFYAVFHRRFTKKETNPVTKREKMVI